MVMADARFEDLDPNPEMVLSVPQGDREDRIKIQNKKEADKKQMDREQEADELMVEAASMAKMGET